MGVDRSLERRARTGNDRRHGGGVLIEFSVSVMALWLIAAATLDLGRAFASAHLLQSAARTAARELALNEQGWGTSFDQAICHIFRDEYLVIDANHLEAIARQDGISPDEVLLRDLRTNNRVLNIALRPLMIFENVRIRGQQRRFLRYPGALLSTGRSDDLSTFQREDFTVGIPEINEAQSRIDLRPVVDELVPGAYGLSSQLPTQGVQPGTATVVIRYPFQAAALSGWRLVDGVNRPVLASETDSYATNTSELGAGVSVMQELDARGGDGSLAAYAQNGLEQTIPVYGGRLGLGYQGLLGQEVRPYRQVISAQAMAPREVIASSQVGTSCE